MSKPPSSKKQKMTSSESATSSSSSTMRPRKNGKRRLRFDDLFEKSLPRTSNVIDSSSFVNDLSDPTKQQLREYIAARCPGSNEIVTALFWIAQTHRTHLRTKELCETLEAITLIGADIHALLHSSSSSTNNNKNDASGALSDALLRKKDMTIYDLACGHGLGGVLLAYRFPSIKVVCIDREERPCWTSYREAFEKFGIKANKSDTSVTSNLSFREGDIMSNKVFQPKEGDYLMSLHGCNELSPFVLTTAQTHKAGFAVMPCCLRDGMLGVTTTSSNNNWGIINDTARYSLQVGYLAGKFGCGKVAAISQFITNRFLVVIGDYYCCKEGDEKSNDLMTPGAGWSQIKEGGIDEKKAE